MAVAEASRRVGDIAPASVVAKLQEGIAVRRGWILVIDAAPGVVARMNVHRFAYDNLRGIALVVKEVIACCSSCRPTTNEAIGSENVGELQVSAGVKFADCVALVIKEIGLRPGFGLGVVLVGVRPQTVIRIVTYIVCAMSGRIPVAIVFEARSCSAVLGEVLQQKCYNLEVARYLNSQSTLLTIPLGKLFVTNGFNRRKIVNPKHSLSLRFFRDAQLRDLFYRLNSSKLKT